MCKLSDKVGQHIKKRSPGKISEAEHTHKRFCVWISFVV